VVDVTTLSISEVAEQAGVSAHPLRYYERAGIDLYRERTRS
jgi:DNA-binding transcriptional MerR regulator